MDGRQELEIPDATSPVSRCLWSPRPAFRGSGHRWGYPLLELVASLLPAMRVGVGAEGMAVLCRSWFV